MTGLGARRCETDGNMRLVAVNVVGRRQHPVRRREDNDVRTNNAFR
jgi:hypothetical protein